MLCLVFQFLDCKRRPFLVSPSNATFFAFLSFLVVTVLFKWLQITVLECRLVFPSARSRDVPRGETMC